MHADINPNDRFGINESLAYAYFIVKGLAVSVLPSFRSLKGGGRCTQPQDSIRISTRPAMRGWLGRYKVAKKRDNSKVFERKVSFSFVICRKEVSLR